MKKVYKISFAVLAIALLTLPFKAIPASAATAKTPVPAPKLVVGKVVALSPSLQVSVNGTRYTVKTAGAELLDLNRKPLKLGSIRAGHIVRIYGIVRAGTITAEVLRDIAVVNPLPLPVPPAQPAHPAPSTPSAPTSTVAVLPAPPTLGIGIGIGNGLAAAIQTPATTTASASAPAAAITPGSVVGVLCSYRYGSGTQLVKGTGVIVNPDGYVLTARHIVDPLWTAMAYNNVLDSSQHDLYSSAVLEHCEVGIPENITFPTADAIRSSNPAALITRNFQYSAQPYFLPNQLGMSQDEYRTADVAILHITGPTPTCMFSNQNCTYSNNFPYTPVTTTLPRAGGDEVLSYGYPAEDNLNNTGTQFYNFYLRGAAGTVGRYTTGDQRFLGQQLSFSFEAQDIQNGRSGSPLFFNGKVIGILYGSTVGTSAESYNLTIPAVIGMLRDSGMDWILRTQ